MTEGPFKTLHHICIVVRDIDRAVAFYESVGIGPWEPMVTLNLVEQHRGISRDDFLALTYKAANLDNVQIQLCQPSTAQTPQRRFLDEHGEGVFHLGFSVPDCETAERDLTGLGLGILLAGRIPGRGGFTYFDTQDTDAGVTLQVRSVKAPLPPKA